MAGLESSSSNHNRWHDLAFLCAKLFIAAALGTLTLMAMADNPWDGDEFIKGPIAGIISFGGGDLKRIFEVLRNIG